MKRQEAMNMPLELDELSFPLLKAYYQHIEPSSSYMCVFSEVPSRITMYAENTM